MKAIAKQDYTLTDHGYEYVNWISGNKYDVRVDSDEYVTIIQDEHDQEHYFCGEPKHLEDRFDFVEEED